MQNRFCLGYALFRMLVLSTVLPITISTRPAERSYPDTSQRSCKVHLRWNCYSPQRDQDEGKPAAASMAMFAAAVAAGMTASTGVRVPAAETLAAAKALRGMAASKALRRVPAAKHRAA